MVKLLGASVLCIGLTGCLLVVDSDKKMGTTQWYQSDLDRVVVGETRTQWVRDAFGEPERISRAEDGTETWRYRNRTSTRSEVGLFLLFSVDRNEDHEEMLALEVRDDVVTDFWVEKR